MGNEDWQKIVLWGSFVFFLGALLLRQETAINQDLGRHLRLGEMIVAGGDDRKCALFTNCLTYTYPDYPFVNHHWGSEVIFYLVHRIGGFPALIIFKTIVLGLAFVITVIHAISSLRGSPPPADDRGNLQDRHAPLRQGFAGLAMTAGAIAITFLSINMIADRLTTRPEIFGYLLFSLLFWILNRKNLGIWGILGIWGTMLLWVNLHISFVFGVILIWIWTGCQVLTSLRGSPDGHRDDRGNPGDRHVPLRQGFVGLAMTMGVPAISTLVTIFNPSGLRGALMPLSILKDYGYTIVENMTPFFLSAFKPQPEYWVYAGLTAAAVILALLTGRLGKFAGLVLLVFSIFPLIAVRHLVFFALTAAPVLTPLIYEKFVLQSRIPLRGTKLPILIVGGLLIVALTNPVPLVNGKLPPANLNADPRHEPAIEFIKQNNLKGQMWNNYDIGSYLEWAAPEYKTFVDGRPEAFPVGFFRQTYIPMQENKEVWDRAVADYNVQWAFAALTDSTPWFIKWWKMIQNHEDWRIVYIDNYSTILIRVNGNNNLIEPQGKAKLLKISGFD